MIDWQRLGSRLAALAARGGDGLLSVTLNLPARPAAVWPGRAPWCHWQRPDQGRWLAGAGRAVRLETGGHGRFAALGAAMAGLRAAWRHDGDVGAPPPLAFVGFAFAPDGGAPLANASLTVPQLLLREDGGAWRACFSTAATEAADALPRWRELWESLTAAQPAEAPQPRRQPAPLEDRAFLARGQAALAAIAAGAADKLVLTRSARVEAERDFEPGAVVAALAAANAGCAVWAVDDDRGAFVGASPELLLAVHGRRVAADALAGTAWRSATADACPPLGSDKNRREHRFVADAVAAALAPLCDSLSEPAAADVLRIQGIEHWRQRLVGERRAGVEAADLLAHLHPTPAVGGTPAAAAQAWLAAHGDRRGAWYCGGVGWLDAAGDADIAVALRCGLLEGRTATLYAGAGFVAGSDPQQEFAETEAKLAPMLAALAAGVGDQRRDRTGT